MKQDDKEASKIKKIDFGEDYMEKEKDSSGVSKATRNVPELHTCNNTKVAKVASHNNLINSEAVGVLALHNSAVPTMLSVQTDKADVTGIDNITPEDVLIMDAVYSLLHAGQTSFSAKQIIRTMYGDPSKKVTADDEAWLDKKIDKLAMTRVTIDYRAEARERGFNQIESCVIKAQALSLRGIKIRLSNGAVINGYTYDSRFAPPLYQYAEAVNQIVSYPSKYLTYGGHTTNLRTANIKNQILMRVRREQAKAKAKKSKKEADKTFKIAYQWYDDKIEKYKGLISDIGLNYLDDKSGNDRKLKCKIHKTVCDLLDDLIISGDIKSYESYRDSGSKKIEGVAITL